MNFHHKRACRNLAVPNDRLMPHHLLSLLGGSPRPPGSNYYWALPPGLELDTLGKAGRLHPKLLKKPYVIWHNPSCWRDTVTPKERGGASGTDLALLFTHMLKSYKDRDPAPRPQVALPVNAIRLASAAHIDTAAPHHGSKFVMAIYFLLWVGEYTLPPAQHVNTRTIQFRVSDIRFWQGQTLLPPTSDTTSLAAATSVTLVMDNQKNGHRGDTIHQEACTTDFCPVSSVAALVSAIMVQDMGISTPPISVRECQYNPHILHAVRRGTQLAQFDKESGYNLVIRIGAHSLRASGAMALWLSGHSPEAIMKLGRWRTQTFLTYIHSQIAALTTGTSRQMGRPVTFQNVGG